MPRRVRSLLLILAWCSRVGADPLWDAEVRLGYGVAVGGGGGMTSTRPTPLSIAAIGSVLVNEEPALSGYGGLTVETLDRNSIGVLGGVKLSPQGSPLRLMGGGTWVFAPLTLWGVTASGGACGHVSRGMGMCGDLLVTGYFAGTDLEKGRTVTQVQLAVSMVFDAL